MKLNWLNNSGFITKKLYAPFAVEKDSEYLQDLSSRYDILFKQAQGAGADKKSIDIIDEYREMILGALEKYYEADIAQCNAIIEELIQDIGDNPLAVDKVNRSRAFPGTLGSEVQFFRGRVVIHPVLIRKRACFICRKAKGQKPAIIDSVFPAIQAFTLLFL